ncbi:uncharacterized protein BDR25DRAFT_360539 [Lindgomyces ingoldianus]|uniref:Uncharacterized protein n=1 Tax=Lindgomyces ingoldianus TaxID=673940 RepID=A0ACB6QFA1_9PLEO|nr:uncharacterized protein BDR25DRAFT_360539 [Lindgomyces ingoldianus]KAF2465601.1 hypothetical protein BDR25DRAFT_360539 [Lindgomyces ingoldianus]
MFRRRCSLGRLSDQDFKAKTKLLPAQPQLNLLSHYPDLVFSSLHHQDTWPTAKGHLKRLLLSPICRQFSHTVGYVDERQRNISCSVLYSKIIHPTPPHPPPSGFNNVSRTQPQSPQHGPKCGLGANKYLRDKVRHTKRYVHSCQNLELGELELQRSAAMLASHAKAWVVSKDDIVIYPIRKFYSSPFCRYFPQNVLYRVKLHCVPVRPREITSLTIVQSAAMLSLANNSRSSFLVNSVQQAKQILHTVSIKQPCNLAAEFNAKSLMRKRMHDKQAGCEHFAAISSHPGCTTVPFEKRENGPAGRLYSQLCTDTIVGVIAKRVGVRGGLVLRGKLA